MKIDRFKNDGSGEPLCKFGPGGEYIRSWPQKGKAAPLASENSLRKVLSTLADIIGTSIHPELLADIESQVDIETQAKHKLAMEVISSADTKPDSTVNPEAASGAKSHLAVRGQPMLFSDDRRIVRRAKRKPQHRIRAHRGPSKKKTAHQIPGQGTLFETNSASPSAA